MIEVKGVKRVTLLFLVGVVFGSVYVIPPDYDEYRRKTDTVYDFTFRYICSTSDGRMECINIPASVKTKQTPYSEIGNANVVIRLKLKGNDRIMLCGDYTNPSTCQTFQLDDYTSIRLEIIPYDQLSTYQIQKPNCTTGTPSVVLPFYTPCSKNNQFTDNGNYWTVNTDCVPVTMNVPVFVFCDTWSK